jgi:3-isopropylmalate dehydrogenase
MTSYRIAVLPGDGIGPEVTAEAVRVLEAAAERFAFGLELEYGAVGAAGVAAAGEPLPADTRAAVRRADAVLLGAVGDPSLDGAP